MGHFIHSVTSHDAAPVANLGTYRAKLVLSASADLGPCQGAGACYARSLVPDGDQAEGRQRDSEAFDVPGAGIDHGQLALPLALPGHDEQPPAIG